MNILKKCLVCTVFSLLPLLHISAIEEVKAFWISSSEQAAGEVNTWIAFRNEFNISNSPRKAKAVIAADTKYWLWVNGKLAVFEGGLKRGPSPGKTYYDVVDLAKYLKKGNNHIAILLWHFGKSGFSHIDSGHAGLFFSMNIGRKSVVSDSTWLCRIHPAYGTTGKPLPNYRLPESNIRFDARLDMPGWQTGTLHTLDGFLPAIQLGRPGNATCDRLIKRPMPQWKDFGVKETAFERRLGKKVDTLIVPLPYNMQMTPILVVNDPVGGNCIGIATDHTRAGGTDNLRAEYITRQGYQEYESYGWLNGEKLLVSVPRGVEVLAVKYRETGYDAAPVGSFTCSDTFYNRFWKKALRTLYVNMRDNYFDCPDRERAQWWGDVVLLMGESFYTYSTSAHALMKKAIRELVAWQKPDGTLHAPVPGNYELELPAQMLAGISRYGFWNYYMNTGDYAVITEVYPAVKRYLSLWKTDETGLTELRKGGWLWGDWGTDKDMRLIMAGWHYLALEGAACMAELLGEREDAVAYRLTMARVKEGYDCCWNGYAYRHPSFQQETDDRVQALAVISGIADSSKYARILQLFKTQFHASPYMEKYVMEALFVMGEGEYALERTRKRFGEMVDSPDHTTLFEGWGIGKKGFGGGTTNHAWSGGAQIVIARHLCGIAPLEAGYQTFLIEPHPASFTTADITIPTVKGMIRSSFENTTDSFILKVEIPEGTNAIIRLQADIAGTLEVNGKPLSVKQQDVHPKWLKEGMVAFSLEQGKYMIRRIRSNYSGEQEN